MGRDMEERNDRLTTGFTLTELLVVVSIIALLVSVLVPSLTQAQRQGERVHCLANQRQLYLAWTLYVANNDDRLCKSMSDLKRYAPLDDVFICKTARQTSPVGVSNTEVLSDSSYDISNTMGGAFRDGVEPYTRFHQVLHPGDSMVFADTEAYIAGSRFWPLLRDSQHKKWLWRPPDVLGLAGITSRHNNGCNMTFADSHGEMIRWKDPRTLGLIKGTVADEVEASNGNPDLDYLVRVLICGKPVQDQVTEGE